MAYALSMMADGSRHDSALASAPPGRQAAVLLFALVGL